MSTVVNATNVSTITSQPSKSKNTNPGDTNTNSNKKSCCDTHYMRCPNTFTQLAFVNCCIGCEKPGLGSNEHNPGDNDCSDCALVCCPCALALDIICFIPMCFGFINIEIPKF